MDGLRTRGQPVAVAAIRAMLGSGLPHAVLLTGPAGVGKTTLALDIAAALLCQAGDIVARPCRTCRGCRMVEHRNHPDLHRLEPAGAGSLISIGGRRERGEPGIRDLVRDLALMPVEGGARVAIVEQAQRMTEDAQSAFLKTLEEPPAGTTIILCADDEERMLPTIRSRCARVRLGPMGPRDVEAILEEQGVADAPTAARLARITDGRPGHAIAYARAPEAATIRAEIARSLLDLLGAGVTGRLTGVRDLAGRASELVRALDVGAAGAADAAGIGARLPGKGRGRGTRAAGANPPTSAARGPSAPPDVSPDATGTEGSVGDAASEVPEKGVRIAPSERRRAALVLVEIWRAVVRDLGLAVAGERAGIRDVALIDDLETAAGGLDLTAVGRALRRLETAGERLEGNVSPELVLDVLALDWIARPGINGSVAARPVAIGRQGSEGAA